MWDSPGQQNRLHHCHPPRAADITLAAHNGEDDKRYAVWAPDSHEHPAAMLDMDLDLDAQWMEGLEASLDIAKVLQH